MTADPENTDDLWEGCSLVLVLVKNVATLVRRRLVKLSLTPLVGRDMSWRA